MKRRATLAVDGVDGIYVGPGDVMPVRRNAEEIRPAAVRRPHQDLLRQCDDL